MVIWGTAGNLGGMFLRDTGLSMNVGIVFVRSVVLANGICSRPTRLSYRKLLLITLVLLNYCSLHIYCPTSDTIPMSSGTSFDSSSQLSTHSNARPPNHRGTPAPTCMRQSRYGDRLIRHLDPIQIVVSSPVAEGERRNI
jgi:hypothetical protein